MAEDRLDLSSDPGSISDPYATLSRLREQEPVRRVLYHGAPAWLVTRFADAEAVYSDPRLAADKAHARNEVRAVPWVVASDMIGLGKTIVFADPPAHTRLRRLVARAFTPRRVVTLRPMVQGIADRLLEAIEPRGRDDTLHEHATPLAALTIMTLLGSPPADREEFTGYAHLFLSTDPADQARMPEAMAWMASYIADLVAAKAAAPADDLLSELIAVRDEGGDRLSEAELRAMAFLLLMAGFETTASFIPNGLLALIHPPGQMAALREDPSLIALGDGGDAATRPDGHRLAAALRDRGSYLRRGPDRQERRRGGLAARGQPPSPPVRPAGRLRRAARGANHRVRARLASTTASARHWPDWRVKSPSPRRWPAARTSGSRSRSASCPTGW